MEHILTCDQLKEIFGCKHSSKLREMLLDNGINFLCDARGRPFTTLEALNARLVTNDEKAYRFA